MKRAEILATLVLALAVVVCQAKAGELIEGGITRAPKNPPKGFIALFNGRDLTGWKGLLKSPADNPIKRAALTAEQLAKKQAEADKLMRKHWKVKNGVLCFDGGGFSLATARDYGDFELYVDWKLLTANGDSGIYLRGSPQVQIWDPAYWKIGSGGLYNNKKNPSKPSKIADKPIGQWNTFYIKMVGERVTVKLNGELIVDNVILENYWNRSKPIFPSGQIELQCHGNPICFRNIFIREIPRPGQFRPLFNGRDLAGWVGDTKGYKVEEGRIILQILDNTADRYKNLKPYQYHGSIYGVVPARRGFLKPVGLWNHQEVIARGPHIRVILNGTTIVDADINEASRDGTMDRRNHPGLKRRKGHIGFLGHGSVVQFRNIELMGL
ncbi:MAG: 3-keto-disaccharide hydrolase [Planctomycetota bacterium]